jgi:hypothetical protein
MQPASLPRITPGGLSASPNRTEAIDCDAIFVAEARALEVGWCRVVNAGQAARQMGEVWHSHAV